MKLWLKRKNGDGKMGGMRNEARKIMAIETSGRRGSVAVGVGSQVIVEKEFTAVNRNAAELLPVMDALCGEAGWKPSEVEELYVSIGPGSFTGLRIAVTVAKAMAYANNVKVVAVPSMEALAMNAAEAEVVDGTRVTNVAVVLEAKRNQVYCAGFARDLRVGAAEILGQKSGSKCTCFDPDLHRNDPEMHQNAPVLPGFDPVLAKSILGVSELLDKMGKPLHILGEGLQFYKKQFLGEGAKSGGVASRCEKFEKCEKCEGVGVPGTDEEDGVKSGGEEEVILLPERYWGARARYVYVCGRRRAAAGLYADADRLEPMYLRRPEAEERWEKKLIVDS